MSKFYYSFVKALRTCAVNTNVSGSSSLAASGIKVLPCKFVLTLFLITSPFTEVLAQTIEPAPDVVVRSLQMPFNPDDASDSNFLRQLLLSHGLLLDIGDKESIGARQYKRLVSSISSGVGKYNPEITDVREEFVLSLLKGTSDSGLSDTNGIEKRPIEHRLVWWEDVNGVTPEPILASARLAPVNSAESDPSIDDTLIQHSDTAVQATAPEVPATNPNPPAAQPEVPPRPIAPIQPLAGVKAPDRSAPENNATQKISRLKVSNDVPERFAALAGPQFMFVDIFFNDEQIGSAGITVSDDTILFEEPEQLVFLLAESVPDEQLINWLSEPLPTNGHLACYADNDPIGCGQVNADPLAVIYNAVLLRLDVFVNPSRQQVEFGQRPRYLDTPVDQTSAIFSLHGVASDLSPGPSRLDLSGNAIVSYGRGNVSADLHYNDDTGRRTVNTLKLTHHLNNYDIRLGTFGFSPGGALNELDLIGAGFSTSFKTRIDLEQAFSSQLTVYLPRRSVVQLLINDRIYSGASYAAGNQALDTTALPDGTYEVEVIINDPVDGQRSERQLFTKSALIPPEGEWNISANAGVLRDSTRQTALPQISDVPTLGFSAARRIGDRSSYRLGILQFDQTSILHNELLYLGEHLSFNMAFSFGDSNLRAASLQSTLRFNDHHLNLSAGHFSSSLVTSDDTVESGFLVPENTRVNFSYHRSLPWVSFGIRFGVRREADPTTAEGQNFRNTRTLSAYAQRPILRSRHSRGFLSLRYQRDDIESLAQLSLNLYFGKGAWRAGTGVTLFNSGTKSSEWQTKASTGWKSDNFNGSTLAADAYVTKGNSTNTYGFNTELKHPWFRADASSDFTRYENSGQTRNSIASFSAYAGIDRYGASLGGSDFAQSGLIVDVSGEPAGESFDVLVNNARVATAKIGNPQFIGLQPFENYNVKLRPNTVMGNGIDKANHTLTLFPGNVGRISLLARRQVLLIAMVVDESGRAIKNALVKSSSNTLIIDDSGILQAEVHDNELLKVRRKDGAECVITVSIDTTEEVDVPDMPVVCATSP